MMTTSRKILPKLAFATALLFLLLLASDRLLGRLGVKARPDSDYVTRYIRLRELAPNLDQTLTMSDALLAECDGLERKPVRMRTDANGFILPHGGGAESKNRVVFLGGSTTECSWLQETNRWPFLAGEALARRSHDVCTINSGVSGNNSLHGLDLLLNKVVPLQPRVVVFMEGINELTTLLNAGTYWNDNVMRSPLVTVDRRPSTRQLIGAPVRDLFPHLHALGGRAASRILDTQITDEFASARGRKLELDAHKITTEFEKSLRCFIAICRAHGIRPVLMTQASRILPEPDEFIRRTVAEKLRVDFQIAWADYAAAYAAINDTTRRVAAAELVTLVDLDQLIPKERRFLYDPVHYTEDGARVAADVITPIIAEELAKVAH